MSENVDKVSMDIEMPSSPEPQRSTSKPINKYVTSEGVEFTPIESEIRSDVINYHGVDIKIISSEHSRVGSFSKDYPEFDTYLPNDWQEKIDTEIGPNPNLIFSEYFIPDLEKGLFSEPLIGLLAKETWAKQFDLFTYYNAIGRMAGQRNCKVAVADTASSSTYMIYEVQGMKMFNNFDRSYNGHELPPDRYDFEYATAIDSRRLMTARAMMEESLRITQDGASNDPKEIVYIGPAAHTSRILAYIQRQKDAEMLPGVVVEKPKDLQTVGQKMDMEKAAKYRKTFGLNTKIRYYSPTQEPFRYKLDDLVQKEEYKTALDLVQGAEQTIGNKAIIGILTRISLDVNRDVKPLKKIFTKVISTASAWKRTGLRKII